MTLDWRGPMVVARTERAARDAAVEIVDDCLTDAGHDTPVDTGAARDSLFREGDGLAIRWGYGAPHGIWIEIGANGKVGVSALRRAADRHYGRLPGRIAGRVSLG